MALADHNPNTVVHCRMDEALGGHNLRNLAGTDITVVNSPVVALAAFPGISGEGFTGARGFFNVGDISSEERQYAINIAPDTKLTGGANSFSVAFWYKADFGTQLTNATDTLFGYFKNNSAFGRNTIVLGRRSGEFRYTAFYGASFGDNIVVQGPLSISDGEWHSVVFVWNIATTSIIIYLDGSANSMSTVDANLATVNVDADEAPLYIGWADIASQRSAEGEFDLFSIWDQVALTPTEVDEFHTDQAQGLWYGRNVEGEFEGVGIFAGTLEISRELNGTFSGAGFLEGTLNVNGNSLTGKFSGSGFLTGTLQVGDNVVTHTLPRTLTEEGRKLPRTLTAIKLN